VLDVWFDSGSTHRAIQTTHPELREAWTRAVSERAPIVYLEGPDQHRGWFNSSLMVAVGLTGRAPYSRVLTHGWVLDADGRAMHKSLGNVVSPLDVVKKYGAEIVRWWALATDWRNDVRVGDEILQRVAEAYRKVRNTFRFLLGNLDGFDPARHAVPRARLTRVDRAFLEHLEGRLARVRRHWESLAFHRALDDLLDLCTVDLSAVFLDVAKDRLYILAPADPARRSAQTVLWQALHDLAIAVSPALVFTSEEVWQHHPALLAELPSVHLAEWPEGSGIGHEAKAIEWAFLLELRAAVNAVLEPMRAAKSIATTTEADVTIHVRSDAVDRVRAYAEELAGFLLVARATIASSEGGEAPFRVEARRTDFLKCERCWTYRDDVTAESGEPLCARCTAVLRETGRTAPRG